jgi:REP element-mobilizing transposase RayT
MSNPARLEPGNFYHIYNRGNNRENLFIQERNYGYFMKLWGKYITPVADTYAYCLLRNHFHATVRIKEAKDLTGLLVTQHFSNLFNAYARAVNIAVGRTGALFQRPFGRILIADDDYLRWLIVYIHQNPQKHGFVDDFRSWPYSSYPGLLAPDATRLKRDEVLALFGGRDEFIRFHAEIQPRQELFDDE